MTRLDVYFYEDTVPPKLVAKYSSTADHPLTSEAHMSPSPKHTSAYKIEPADDRPFDCEVISVFNDNRYPPHLGLSINIDELARWDEQHRQLNFELVST